MDPDLEAQRRVGSTLCNKWTLERLIGTGGMAAVYVGAHKIGRREAIKILHADVARDPELRARFEQEAHAVNRFRHPGAVEIRDIDVAEDGSPFLVMELLEGEPLSELARKPGGVPLPDLLRIVDEMLDVLAAAHAQGIIHRDIKPDNLFVMKDGHVKVLDFGIARVRAGAPKLRTRAGATLGTAPYMPPEQIRGQEIDARADLFAVGATMFRLIARRRVHEAPTEQEMLVKMASEPAPPLATVAPDAPRDVGFVVDRALAFARDQRYPDATTMQRDVRALREGKPPPYAHARLLEGTPAPSALRAPAILSALLPPVPPPAGSIAAALPPVPPPASVAGTGAHAAFTGSAVIVPPTSMDAPTRMPMSGEEPTAFAGAAALPALGAQAVGPTALAAPITAATATATPIGAAAPERTAAASPVAIQSSVLVAATTPPTGAVTQGGAEAAVPSAEPTTRPLAPAGVDAAAPADVTPPSAGVLRPPGANTTLRSQGGPVNGANARPHGYHVPTGAMAPVAAPAGATAASHTQPAGAEPLPPGASIPVVRPSRYRTLTGQEPNVALLVLVGIVFAALGVGLTLWLMLRGSRDTSATAPAASASASAEPPLDPADIWPRNPRPTPRPQTPSRGPAPQPQQPSYPQPGPQQPSYPQPGTQPQQPSYPSPQPPTYPSPQQPQQQPASPAPQPTGKGKGHGHGK